MDLDSCLCQQTCYPECDRVFFCTLNPSGKGKGKAVPLQAWTGPEGS